MELKVERNGNEGPIQIQVEAVPEGISVKADGIAEGESAGKIELAAAQSMGDEEIAANLPVTVKIGEVEAKQLLSLSVPKLNLPKFLPASEVLLQPGTSRTVDVSLQRDGYKGPIELRVDAAPAKIACKVANVTADESATTLEIKAAGDAPDGSHKIRVATDPVRPEHQRGGAGESREQTVPGRCLQGGDRRAGPDQRVEVPIERSSYQGPAATRGRGPARRCHGQRGGSGPRPDQCHPGDRCDARGRAASPLVASRLHRRPLDQHRADRDPHIGSDDTLPAAGDRPRIRRSAPLLRRGSIGGRLTTESKQALLDFYGGTPESEAAVMRGLAWLAAHQQADGSWPLNDYSKDIPDCDCQGEFEKEVDDSDHGGHGVRRAALPRRRRDAQSAPERSARAGRVPERSWRKAWCICPSTRSEATIRDDKTDGLSGRQHVRPRLGHDRLLRSLRTVRRRSV